MSQDTDTVVYRRGPYISNTIYNHCLTPQQYWSVLILLVTWAHKSHLVMCEHLFCAASDHIDLHDTAVCRPQHVHLNASVPHTTECSSLASLATKTVLCAFSATHSKCTPFLLFKSSPHLWKGLIWKCGCRDLSIQSRALINVRHWCQDGTCLGL